MKLLLINPRFPESFWSFKWANDHILSGKRDTNPPLGLATLAALCPEDWQVQIVDENIESIPLEPEADLVGVCGMGVQFSRQKELLSFYGRKGYYTVAGGSYASLCPELYTDLANAVVAGEAEYIWPEFCRDFEQGRPREMYRETGEVSLLDSPVPRYDLLDLGKYRSAAMQFSRGCPFRCDFCDIIVMFGRKPRVKSVQQVGKELDLLRRLDVHSAFFVDDNLIGNIRQAKELMRFLHDYQKQHNYSFSFGTEASINMAYDDELLALFRDANFKWVFIGIESPDEDSLRETKKLQNLRQDLLTSIQKIYAHGMDVLAGFIIGFDNDTPKVFDMQFRFIMESGIQTAMVGLLTAMPKTPLYDRLLAENRILHDYSTGDNTKLRTNVVPKQMSYDTMVRGFRDLYHRLLEERNIATRIKNKLRYYQPSEGGKKFPVREAVPIVRKFLVHGILPGGFRRIFHFVRTLPFSSPKMLPLVLQDWIVGLAMRDYVDRNFVHEFEKANNLAHRYAALFEKAMQRYLNIGALEVSFSQVKNAAATLSISLQGTLDRTFFKRTTRHLERLLENTASSIVIEIDEFHEAQLKYLNRLLKQLSQYGDRIYIAINEELCSLIDIDSSRFNLVLVEAR